MCYCKCNKRGWNNIQTYGFHDELQRDTRAFYIPVDHDYWKFSCKNAPNHMNYGGSSEVGCTQGTYMADQHTSDISELLQIQQGNSADYNFTSFLSNLSEFVDFLKWFGIAFFTGLAMFIYSFHQYLHIYHYIFPLCYLWQVCIFSYHRYGILWLSLFQVCSYL